MFTRNNTEYEYPELPNINLKSLATNNTNKNRKYCVSNKYSALCGDVYGYNNSKNLTHSAYKLRKAYTTLTNLYAISFDAVKDKYNLLVPTALSAIISRTNYNDIHNEEFTTILNSLRININNAGLTTYHYNIDMDDNTIRNRLSRFHTVYLSSGISFLTNMIAEKGDCINRLTHYEQILQALVKPFQEEMPIFRVLYGDYSNSGHSNYYIYTNKMNENILSAINILYFILNSTYTNRDEYNKIKPIYEELFELIEQNKKEEINFKEENMPDIFRYIMTNICEQYLTCAQNNTIDNVLDNTIYNAITTYWKFKVLNYTNASKTDFLTNMQKSYNDIVFKTDRDMIRNLKDSIQTSYTTLQRYQSELAKLERKMVSAQEYNINEFKNFFDVLTLYKTITTIAQDENSIDIIIKAPLTYFDQADATALFNRQGSYVNEEINYCARQTDYLPELCSSIFRDVFIRGTTKLHTFSAFRICLTTSDDHYSNTYPISIHTGDVYNAITSSQQYQECKKNYIWQPHIMGYHCYNDAQTAFYKAMMDLDFETALAQLIGATQNLTVSDSTVFKYLIQYIFCNDTIKAFEMNGTMYSFKELHAIKLLEKEELEKKYATEPDTPPIIDTTTVPLTVPNLEDLIDPHLIINAIEEAVTQHGEETENN